MKIRTKLLATLMAAALCGFMTTACAPPKAEKATIAPIPDGTVDPAVWGKNYPEEYETWKKTAEATPEGKSKYKKGNLISANLPQIGKTTYLVTVAC